MDVVSRIFLNGYLRTLVLVIATIAGMSSSVAVAQQPFASPDKAAAALAKAARSGDRRSVLAVLGQEGTHIALSGDPVEDARLRARFAEAYEARHRIEMEGDDKAILMIGPQEFPFPVAIVRKNSRWRFDSGAGRKEVLARRIDRNEARAIEACLLYYEAQNQYAKKDRTGAGVSSYARWIVSERGKKDGLYWPAAQGEDQSPLSGLMAQAAADGYRNVERPAPFHGYYFKVLTKQGKDAVGGELDYVAGGNMIRGFALVAWPAAYGRSGVKTFIVSHAGIVYEKDLGAQTNRVAERMDSFNPDVTWLKVSVPAYERK
jgi:hypothetical protein